MWMDSDEPVQPPFKLKNPNGVWSGTLQSKNNLNSDQPAQAGLSLYWSHIPHCKSYATAH